jgi:signal transduction histidine kinase
MTNVAVLTGEHAAAALAHDFNNQLTAAIGYMSLYDASQTPGWLVEVSKALESMRILCAETLSMVKQMAADTSTQSGQADIRSTHDVVEGVLAQFLLVANTKQITMLFEGNTDLPLFQLSPSEFERVLANLVSNAVKFTPNGGLIIVRAIEETSGFYNFEVEDTGPGIDPDLLSSIWNPFAQGPHDPAHGIGLGLAIVKGIVEQSGGRIAVKSEVGRGSTFTLEIPVNTEPRNLVRRANV